MPFLARKQRLDVQGLVLKIVNNNCPELKCLADGPRLDNRVNLTVVVLVIPVVNKKLCLGQAFTAVTKEFSNTGVAIVLDEPLPLEEAVLGFRFEGDMSFVHGKVKHLNPMGGGFYQMGFQLDRMVYVGDHPELKAISF